MINKKVVLFGFLFLIIGFVSAGYFPKENNQNVFAADIEDGWNLIYGFADPAQIEEGGYFTKEDITAIYGFNPLSKQYIRMYPDREKTEITGDYLSQTAFWVYTKKSGVMNYNLYKPFPLIREKGLYSGWNFFAVSPDFVFSDVETGKLLTNRLTLDEVKGNCNIEKVYGWNPADQEWDVFPNLNSEFEGSVIGMGMLIKVSSDCTLGSSGSATGPPSLPGGENNVNNAKDLSDFPQKIGSYTLNESDFDDEDCGQLNGQEICVSSYRVEYVSGNSAIHVLPSILSKGKQQYVDYLKNGSDTSFEGVSGVIRGKERWELYWATDSDFDVIGVQNYIYHFNSDGISTELVNATTNNPVVQYFLNKYPPINL